MKKQFLAAAVVSVAALFLAGCNSDEQPSELDNLINQLQTSQMTSETEPEETPDEITKPEDSDKSEDDPDGNGNNAVTYDSVTVTVLSLEEDHISVESGGVVYNIIIDDNTQIFGGDISESKTITVTYILTENDTEVNITAAVITVLPEDESTAQE